MTHRGIHIEGRPLRTPKPGPAPMLQWLPVDRLIVDDSYQRPLGKSNWVAIEKIAENFQWSRFAPVLVAPVEGGLFAIIDGQHRTHAAALCGIAEVPALVVSVGVEEQSRAFSWVNSQTVRVTVFHVYKAALAAREDWAVRAEAAVSAAGCRLMTSNASTSAKQPRQVYNIGFIRRQIEAGQDEAVRLGLASIAAAPSQSERAVAYNDYLLRPWIVAVGDSGCTNLAALTHALGTVNPFKVVESNCGLALQRRALCNLINRAEVPA